MGMKTLIEWAHATWSLWHGCAKVSAGCEHCYAAKNAPRNPAVLGKWGVHGTRVLAADWRWPALFSLDRKAARTGERLRVFPSICDPFEDWPGQVTSHDGWPLYWDADACDFGPRDGDGTLPPLTLAVLRDFWHALIALTPNLDHMLLTKRPEVAARYYADPGLYGRVLKHADQIRERGDVGHDAGVSDPVGLGRLNRWLLASVEDQATTSRVGPLLECPAAVLGLSMEPLLGPVAHLGYCPDCGSHRDFGGRCLCADKPHLSLVIVGGESGSNARPMYPGWPRVIRDGCIASGTAYYFKQWGEWAPIDDDTPRGARLGFVRPDGRVSMAVSGYEPGCPCDHSPREESMARVGKKHAGRILDGRTWDELPELAEATR